MEVLTIRLATAQDTPRLQDLTHEQQDIVGQLDPRLMYLAPPTFADAEQVWVAVQGERIVGYVALNFDENAVQVQHMVVDAHDGGGGVGSVLLDAAKDAGRERGLHALTVTVPRGIAVQQAFWRAKGASVVTETLLLKWD